MRERAKPGRPREFDEDRALGAIMEVFWANGFEGTSMQDLVGATGLKKGSLYAAFGDKRQMYLRALALYDRSWVENAVQSLTGVGNPGGRIATFLRSGISLGDQSGGSRGCFICNAAVDQAPVDAATGAQVCASLRRLEQALCTAVSEHLSGDKPSGEKCESAVRHARHLMAAYYGLRVLARAGAQPAILEDAYHAAMESLDAQTPMQGK